MRHHLGSGKPAGSELNLHDGTNIPFRALLAHFDLTGKYPCWMENNARCGC